MVQEERSVSGLRRLECCAAAGSSLVAAAASAIWGAARPAVPPAALAARLRVVVNPMLRRLLLLLSVDIYILPAVSAQIAPSSSAPFLLFLWARAVCLQPRLCCCSSSAAPPPFSSRLTWKSHFDIATNQSQRQGYVSQMTFHSPVLCGKEEVKDRPEDVTHWLRSACADPSWLFCDSWSAQRQ